MQIPGNHSLAILAAHYSPNQDPSAQQTRQQAEQQNQAQVQQQRQIINSQYANEQSSFRGGRRFTNLQDQNLSHRGQQAQNAYQDIEMAGDTELLSRLDVVV